MSNLINLCYILYSGWYILYFFTNTYIFTNIYSHTGVNQVYSDEPKWKHCSCGLYAAVFSHELSCFKMCPNDTYCTHSLWYSYTETTLCLLTYPLCKKHPIVFSLPTRQPRGIRKLCAQKALYICLSCMCFTVSVVLFKY